jgi:hypothetical protein
MQEVDLEGMFAHWEKSSGQALVMQLARVTSSGGGARGGAGHGGISKSMRMEAFTALKVSEQGAFIRSGGRLED